MYCSSQRQVQNVSVIRAGVPPRERTEILALQEASENTRFLNKGSTICNECKKFHILFLFKQFLF